jgi:hypothetical protein
VRAARGWSRRGLQTTAKKWPNIASLRTQHAAVAPSILQLQARQGGAVKVGPCHLEDCWGRHKGQAVAGVCVRVGAGVPTGRGPHNSAVACSLHRVRGTTACNGPAVISGKTRGGGSTPQVQQQPPRISSTMRQRGGGRGGQSTHLRYASATWDGHVVLRGVRGDPAESRSRGQELPVNPSTCIISCTSTVTKVS